MKKIGVYIISLLVGVFICSACLGLLAAVYKQKGRVKQIAKALYLRFSEGKPEKTAGKNNIPDADVDFGKEIVIEVDASKKLSYINPLLYGSNLEPKMETENDIVEFIKSVGITCFRFPGGGSPGYHWKTGEFDFTDRYLNVPLRSINYAIDFFKRTDTKPIIQVNVESGTAQEAAEWVEYMNKKANFPVRYWEIGNEVYGDWDQGYMSADKYAKVIKDFAVAMKKADPNVKIGMDWAPERKENFNIEVIKKAGEYIDFVSIHWYPSHTNATHKWEGRIHPTPKEVMANYRQIPRIVKRAKELFSKYAPKRTQEVETAFLEWDGAWDGLSSDFPPYSQGILAWSLANAIFHADCLGQFAVNQVSVSTQYNLQEIMHSLIRGWDREAGWGGQRWDGEIVRPKAFAIKLYSRHFGDILIDSKIINSPYYFKSPDWWADSYTGDVPYVTCYASRFSKENKLSLMLINKHAEKNYKVRIRIKGVIPQGTANLWVLNGPNLLSQNEEHPVNVRIKEYKVENVDDDFTYTIPAHSVNAMEIEFK